MLHTKDLPLNLWAEAVNTAIYLLNRTVPATNEVTPFEMWNGKRPCIDHLRIFGSEAFVHIPKQFTKKFDLRAKKKILVGYQDDSTNYRVYDPITKQVSVSRDVTFLEKAGSKSDQSEEEDSVIKLPGTKLEIRNEKEDKAENKEAVEAAEVLNDPETDCESQVDGQEISDASEKRKLRDRTTLKPPSRYEANIVEYTVSMTFEEAMSGRDAVYWASAIKEELQAHETNQTWSIVSRTPELQTVDSK